MTHDNVNRRNTRQRQVVLDELRKLSCHPTASELHARARTRLPRISLGTVYRNLELLAELGLVHKIETAGTETRFDGRVDAHYHVRCFRCGRLDDAPGVVVEPLQIEIPSVAGYTILGHRLEFIGICPECKNGQGAQGENGPPDGGV